MTAAVHLFPGMESSGPKKAWAASPRPEPQLERFDADQTKELALLLRRVTQGCRTLQDFIASDREIARDAGIESIAIEITAICEGSHLERLEDALEDALAHHEPISLTTEGLSRIRRLEALLAEASRNVSRFTGSSVALSGAATPQALSEAKSISAENIMVGYLLALGAIAVTIILISKSNP